MEPLVGKNVKHKAFGEGIIKVVNEDKIVIEFAMGQRILRYPDAFESF